MTDLLDQFTAATSLTDELELVVDGQQLPVFDTTTHTREAVAAELGPLISRALKAQAELLGSVPKLNAAREKHVAKVEASLDRARQEHEVGMVETLRPSPRGAALAQVADNELSASMQLGSTVTSILEDISAAFGAMNKRLAVLDQEAGLEPVGDTLPSWSILAHGAIATYLDETK